MNVIVTGVSGFLGSKIASFMAHTDTINVLGLSRHENLRTSYNTLVVKDFFSTELPKVLQNYEVIIHAAGLTHSSKSNISAQKYHESNVELTKKLAEDAVIAGVKRFIYISSAGVFGKGRSEPFTEMDHPYPESEYAKSKLRAERELWKVCEKTNLEVVIVRPPMIYGLEAPGNFSTLTKAVKLGLPLPFGSLENRRSLINVENFANFIKIACSHPNAANEIFLVSDQKDLTLKELIYSISISLNKKISVYPFPKFVLAIVLTLLRQKKIKDSLLENFQINNQKAFDYCNWQPSLSADKALKKLFEGATNNQSR